MVWAQKGVVVEDGVTQGGPSVDKTKILVHDKPPLQDAGVMARRAADELRLLGDCGLGPKLAETKATMQIPLPKGIGPITFKGNERTKHWVHYCSALKMPESGRAAVKDNASASIMRRVLGHHEKVYFFHLWWAAKESWGNVQCIEDVLFTERRRRLP